MSAGRCNQVAQVLDESRFAKRTRTNALDPSLLDAEAARKVIANRKSAFKSRAKKKEQLQVLEQQVLHAAHHAANVLDHTRTLATARQQALSTAQQLFQAATKLAAELASLTESPATPIPPVPHYNAPEGLDSTNAPSQAAPTSASTIPLPPFPQLLHLGQLSSSLRPRSKSGQAAAATNAARLLAESLGIKKPVAQPGTPTAPADAPHTGSHRAGTAAMQRNPSLVCPPTAFQGLGAAPAAFQAPPSRRPVSGDPQMLTGTDLKLTACSVHNPLAAEVAAAEADVDAGSPARRTGKRQSRDSTETLYGVYRGDAHEESWERRVAPRTADPLTAHRRAVGGTGVVHSDQLGTGPWADCAGLLYPAEPMPLHYTLHTGDRNVETLFVGLDC